MSATKLWIAWLLLIIAIVAFFFAGYVVAMSLFPPDRLMIFFCSLGIATSICGTLLATRLEKQ